MCLNIDGNSSTCTPDVGLASGNEGNHTVYEMFSKHLEDGFESVVGKDFYLFLPTLDIHLKYSYDIVNAMLDFKAMTGVVGSSYTGVGCICLGGRKKADAKSTLGTCRLLSVEERCELGSVYEDYATFTYDGEHVTKGTTPKEKRDQVRNFVSSSPTSKCDTVTDASHGAIARGTMVLRVVYREAAEVYVGHRGKMSPEQKLLVDQAEKI